MAERDVATLAGGCFWCLEAVFARLRGVHSVTPGYMGGNVPSPTYEQVCTDTTGHAEVVRIEYDPAVISYRELLEVFFAIHDPTTLNRQGDDVGSQYRSAIFYHNEAQRREAHEIVREMTESKAFRWPILTEIAPAGEFYRAEDYHHDYFRRNRAEPYCELVVAPKYEKFLKKFAAKLKPE